MNTTFKPFKKQFLITAITLFVVGLFSIRANAQCSAPTLKFHSPVLISGTDAQTGAIYLFQNVIPGVDANIEIAGIFGGAILYNIDDSTGIGYYDAFQPYVEAARNDTSYIDWKITFKVAGTNVDTALACLAVTGVDVDGNGANLQEFIEAATPGSIAVDPASILQISFDGVRSKAIATTHNVPLIDTAHLEAMFQMNFTNISTLLYRNGAIARNGGALVRQTCIYFKPFFQSYMLLPVKLLSLSARSVGELNRVDWSATNEADIRNYAVEKSVDGTNWKEIATKDRGASTTTNNYYVIDSEKRNGESYYRIKSINNRGIISYSKIIKLSNYNSTSKSIIHNTLITNSINFQVYGTNNDQYTVDYYSMNGTKLKQDKFSIYPGINSRSFEFPSHTAPGIYLLVIKNNKGQQLHSSRVVKN